MLSTIRSRSKPVDLGIPHLARRVPEVELDQGLDVHRERAVLQEERKQHAVEFLGHARIRRELLVERRPGVIHVCR